MIRRFKEDLSETERALARMMTRQLHAEFGTHPVEMYEREGYLLAVQPHTGKCVQGGKRTPRPETPK